MLDGSLNVAVSPFELIAIKKKFCLRSHPQIGIHVAIASTHPQHFELPDTAQQLLRRLAKMCESPTTTTQALVDVIAQQAPQVSTAEEATRYLATLTTINIADRAKMPNYTTMVQSFIGTLPLHMAVYMLDYYLPMLSPYEGYNETGLTQQAAGPVREPGQPITFEYLFQGSEFGHWRVTGDTDTFAFRHPSLGTMEVLKLLESDAHHHKVCPVTAGRLIAIIGREDARARWTIQPCKCSSG